MPEANKDIKPLKEGEIPEGAKYELTIKIDNEGNEALLYLKAVSRHLLGMVFKIAMPTNGSADLIRAGELIITNCLIETHSWNQIKDDETLYVSACLGAYEIIDIKETSVKKL